MSLTSQLAAFAWAIGFAVILLGIDTNPASAADHRMDTAYMTPDFQAAIVVHPARIFANPTVAPAKIDAFMARTVWDGRFDPATVERLAFLYGATIPADLERMQGRFNLGLVMRTNKPFDSKAFTEPASRRKAEATAVAGKTIYVFSTGEYKAVAFPDDRTALWASTPELLVAMWNARDVKSPLIDELTKLEPNHDLVAVGMLEPLRAGFTAIVKVRPVPEPFQAVNDLPSQIRSASAWVDLSGGQLAEIQLTAYDDDSAKALRTTAEEYLTLAKGLWVVTGRRVLESLSRDGAKELADSLAITLREFLDSPMVTRDANVVKATWRRPAALDKLFAAMPVALRQIDSVVQMNRRANDLSTIGKSIAVWQATTNGMLPLPAIGSEDGKPLLSWRVAMLPYLDEKALYDKFRLDEPWDSEHNMALIAEMPRVFEPLGETKLGKTRFLAVVGKETAFPPDAKRGIARIPDGDTNTILLVEVGADNAVTWTKPDDYAFDPDAPKAGLGKASERGYLVLFGDKRVIPIRGDIDANVLAALFTRDGGESVRPEDYEWVPNAQQE